MRLITFGAKLITFFGLWVVISLCWVGAEVVFEGYVHSSKVDAYFAALLAYFVLRDIIHLDSRLTERKDGDSNE